MRKKNSINSQEVNNRNRHRNYPDLWTLMEFKITGLYVKYLVEKDKQIHKQMENFSREMETIKTLWVIEISKHRISERKNSSDIFIKFSIEAEKIDELDRSTEIIEMKTQRENRAGVATSLQALLNNLAHTILLYCLVSFRIGFGPVDMASSPCIYANNSQVCHKYVVKIRL